MKLNAMLGKGSGKVGGLVFSVSGGVQIVKEKATNVSNPNTDAQVEQRAKLKLMSQLAAALAPAIAFKKQGLVSARNQFVSANIGKVTYENGEASVDVKLLDLTGGSRMLPGISVTAGESGNANVALDAGADESINAVVYALAAYESLEEFSLIDVKIVTAPGADRTFAVSMDKVGDNNVIYAYGLVASDGSKNVAYGDYAIADLGQVATLDTIASIVKSAAALTKTRAGYITF